MGDRTRAQLMTQAGLATGDDTQASFVRTWLDDWLARTAKTWSWPVLKKRVSDLAMATGDASVACGKGVSTTVAGVTATTHYIHRLWGGVVFWRSASGFTPRGRAFVRPLSDGDPDIDESNTDPTLRKGSPETVKVRNTEAGKLTLFPNPTPDRSMLLSFDAHIVPARIGDLAASDSQAPWYPNDRTLTQACKCAILESNTSGEVAQVFDQEMAKLAAMVVDDRDFDGDQAGDNQVFQYDPSVFR